MRRPAPAVLVGGALGLPLLVLAVRALLDGHPSPSGDVALIEVRVRDVGTAHNPLLGSYGRYGFNHPGPLWFYALALPYRLTGSLAVGVLLVGALSVAAIVWVAARHGSLLWAGLLTAVLVWGAGPALVSNPWEPHGLLLPGAALLLLAFDAASGRAWSLPLVAGVASLLAAAQATLLPYAVAMGLLAAAVLAWRTGDRRTLLAPAAVTAGVLTVLWLPTLVQQVTGSEPNLTAMWHARTADEPSLGLAGAWDAVALHLGHRGPWLGWSVPLDGLSPTVDLGAAPLVPIGLVALLAALGAAVAGRRGAEPLLPAIALVAVVAGVVAMSRLLGPVFVWIPEWLRVVAFGAWLAAGWALARLVPGWVPAAGIVVVAGLATFDAATHDRERDHVGEAIRSLAAEVPAGPEPVLVTSTADADLVFGGRGIGTEVLVLALERAGTAAVVDGDLADRFGPRRARPHRAARELRLVSGADLPAGYRVVGSADPLPLPLRRERERLLADLGLTPDATAGDILRAGAADPARRATAERAHAIPDLPVLTLLERG